MNNFLFITLIFILWIPFSGITKATTYYGDRYNTSHLGYGFNSSLFKATKPCLLGDKEFQKKTQGKLDFIYNLQSKQLRERTYGEIHGGVNLFILAGSVSTSVYHKTSTNSQTLSNTILFKYDAGATTLENRKAHSGLNTDNCHNSFIYQINHGQDIYLTAKLRFKTIDDYKKFVTKIKIRILWKKKTKTKTKILEKYAKNAVFTVSVNSNGKLPNQLNKLISEKKLTCRGDNIEPCIDSYLSLSSYLYANDGLSQDMQQMEPPVRSIITRTYSKSGHYEFNAPLITPSPTLLALFNIIEENYGILIQEEALAKSLYELSETPEEKEETQTNWNTAKENRKELENIRSQCFEEPNFVNCSL